RRHTRSDRDWSSDVCSSDLFASVAIKHIEFLRIGTRVPIFLPQRITPELCATLAKHHPLWMSVHVNHPRELTIEVKEALERLARSEERRVGKEVVTRAADA